MKRFFNKKQRLALELVAGGKCLYCGKSLPSHWHSDHIIPFSKGGLTDVLNGQALCPSCNLRKGNKMTPVIKLRDWQERVLKQSLKTFSANQKLFLTQATPGGGKTIHGLSVFDSMPCTHVVILAPTTTLVNQWQEDAKKYYGIELKTSMLYSNQDDFSQYQGIVMTYQGMNENTENLRIFSGAHNPLVIADEIHHVADGQSWGTAFRNAFDPVDSILALTGTPWASEGKAIAFVKYGDDGFSIPDFSYSKKRAIADKVCRVTEFHGMKPRDLMFVSKATGEADTYPTLEDAIEAKVKGAYTRTLGSLKHFKSLFIAADVNLKTIRQTTPDAGGLIVAPSIKIAHEFKDELFSLTGEEYRIVHSKSEKPHKSIKDFRNSGERWLISVDMVTEGVDIKRLQVCVFLSTKNTELFLRQVIGRIERRRNPLFLHDRTAYFYYTDTPELRARMSQFEEENKAGLALEESESGDLPEHELGDRTFSDEDEVTLEDVTTELESLTAQGYEFPMVVVKEAIKRQRRSSSWFGDMPLFYICKVIMEEQDTTKEDQATAYADDYDAPVEVKVSRLRTKISKEINRKLYAKYGRSVTGQEIAMAHGAINKRVGITKTDDSTSLISLERKLEYINNSEARSWAY